MAWFSFWRRKTAPAVPKAQVRRHDAARPTRIAGGFAIQPTTLMETHRMDLPGLVAHSRMLAQNNDYYRAFLLSCRRHIVGPGGIAMQAQAKRQNGALDTQDNDTIEAGFAQWAKRGNCTVCGRLSWLDVQRMIAMMVPRDGGVFVRLYRGRQYGPHGFQIQLLPVDRLDTDYVTELKGGGYVNGGVECDDLDKPVAWHFRKQRPGQTWINGGQRIRIPASDILYVAVPEDYSVHLSMPWAFTAMRRLNMLHGFEEAALTAARAGAAKMGFFTRTTDQEPADDDPAPKIEEFDPGAMETLPIGYDVKTFDTGYPDGESPLFVKLMLRGAAAGMGMSYNGLANDLSDTNFSSLHVGKSEERDEWRILQNWMIEHFCEPVIGEWLPMAILTGAMNLPYSKLDKFQQRVFKPRGWAAVNPVDEVNSNIAKVGAGFISPQRVVAADGGDYDDVLNEIAQAKDKATQLGLQFAPAMAPMPQAQPQTGGTDAAKP